MAKMKEKKNQSVSIFFKSEITNFL